MYDAELGDDVYGDDPTVNLPTGADPRRCWARRRACSSPPVPRATWCRCLAHDGGAATRFCWATSATSSSHEAGGASVLGGVVLYPHRRPTAYGELAPEADRRRGKAGTTTTGRAPGCCASRTPTTPAPGGRWTGPRPRPWSLRGARRRARQCTWTARACSTPRWRWIVPAAELAADVDSVTFCLSKGLSCPVGSVVCGSREFIDEATRWRKMLGAGMRQVGVLAAAGLVALDTMIERLAEDHQPTPRALAHGLAAVRCRASWIPI